MHNKTPRRIGEREKSGYKFDKTMAKNFPHD